MLQNLQAPIYSTRVHEKTVNNGSIRNIGIFGVDRKQMRAVEKFIWSSLIQKPSSLEPEEPFQLNKLAN